MRGATKFQGVYRQFAARKHVSAIRERQAAEVTAMRAGQIAEGAAVEMSSQLVRVCVCVSVCVCL
jgi:hypothetical protein